MAASDNEALVFATDDRTALTGRDERQEATRTMQHIGRHLAEARDGPLASDTDLTVAKHGRELWPTPVVWSAAGKRHVYELMALKIGSNLELWPVYAFRRSLDRGEPEPPTAWTVPPRYVL